MAEPTTAKPRKPATPRKSAAAKAPPAAKQRFAKALDEARAGAEALTKEAQDRAANYRAKAASQSSEWIDEAKELSEQAKEKAFILAQEGKTKTSEAIHGLGQVVEDNAAIIDEKVGPKYGDYARTAAKGMKDAAEKIDNKDLGELGEDAKEFVRKSPGVAVAMAAAAGFLLSRLFRRSN
jgi:ElaB/YqjD/DUF883 family membrane-anchored ribosome-binding protein